jgi:putative oxidoreductase
MKLVDWIARIVAALVLLQTLFFKFQGAEESVFIFSQLGVEPWGRYASGFLELAASILILAPRTVWMGCLLGLGLMSGAILSHIAVLGIVVQDDGGLLFGLGIVVFLSCLVSLVIHRADIPVLGGSERR